MAYRIPVLETYEYQQAVISVLSTPPISPVKGNRYVVGASPTGGWIGQENKIAWYDGLVWMFDNPAAGWQIYLQSTSTQMMYTGSAWGVAGSSVFEQVANKSNNTALGVSDTLYPTQNAVKAYADTKTTLTQVKADADIADAIAKKHDGAAQDTAIASKATLSEVKADIDVANAISKAHTAGTDQGLDAGGANAITAAQAKEAYDKRGVYDTALGVVIMNL